MLRVSQFQNPIVNPAKCKGCPNVKDEDGLFQGYCEECFASGQIKPCPNCDRYFHEDEGVQGYCPECGGDFFQSDNRNRLVDTRGPY